MFSCCGSGSTFEPAVPTLRLHLNSMLASAGSRGSQVLPKAEAARRPIPLAYRAAGSSAKWPWRPILIILRNMARYVGQE